MFVCVGLMIFFFGFCCCFSGRFSLCCVHYSYHYIIFIRDIISSLIQLFLISASKLDAYLNFKYYIERKRERERKMRPTIARTRGHLLAHLTHAIRMDHLGSNVAVVRVRAHKRTRIPCFVVKYSVLCQEKRIPPFSLLIQFMSVVSFYLSVVGVYCL